MADTRLTKVGPFRAALLCAFAAFCPTRLVEAERADEEARKRLPQPAPPEAPRAVQVTRGLWASLAWVLGSIMAGYVSGKALGTVSGPAATRFVAALQVFGATILLWATLFVRGWEIQILGSSMDASQVRRWIAAFEAAAEADRWALRSRGPDSAWSIRVSLSMIAAAERDGHRQPPRDPLREAEAEGVRAVWARLRRRLAP